MTSRTRWPVVRSARVALPKGAPPEISDLINPADQPLHVFGVTLIGFTPANGRKLLLTLALAIVAPGLAWIFNKSIKALTPGAPNRAVSFWTRQGVSLITAVLVI